MSDIETAELEEIAIINDIAFDTRVILFNDNTHSLDEVINQIIKAINCNYNKAEQIATEAHTKGKAVVYNGDLLQCLRVSSVLEEINLHTQIEC